MSRTTGVRQHVRPTQRDEIRVWIPKEQQWMTLDELAYRQITKSELRADTKSIETCASPASELLAAQWESM